MLNPNIIKEESCSAESSQLSLDFGLTSEPKGECTGPAGKDGLSAYQIAVIGGFVGTYVQWLASIIGPTGLSAYQLAVQNGFVGTLTQWLESLKGNDRAWLIEQINLVNLQKVTDVGNITTNNIILNKSEAVILGNPVFVQSIAAGGNGAGTALNQFAEGSPYDVAFDSAGNMFVAELERVLKFAPGATPGTFEPFGTVVIGPGDAFNQVYGPLSLCFHNNDLYISDQNKYRIIKLPNGNGAPVLFFSGPLFSFYPYGMVFDSLGNAYVTNNNGSFGAIVKIAPGELTTGTNVYAFTGANLNNPFDIAIDSNDNLYATGWGSNTVIKRAAGQTNWTLLVESPKIFAPYGIIVHPDGFLYVASNAGINRIHPVTGALTLLKDSLGVQLPWSYGLARLNDDLYVSTRDEKVIKLFIDNAPVNLSNKNGKLHSKGRRVLTEDDAQTGSIDTTAVHKTGNEIIELGAIKDFKSSPIVPFGVDENQAANIGNIIVLPNDIRFQRIQRVIPRIRVLTSAPGMCKEFLRIVPANNYIHCRISVINSASIVKDFEFLAGYDALGNGNWYKLTPINVYADRPGNFDIHVKRVDAFGPLNFGILFRYHNTSSTAVTSDAVVKLDFALELPAVGTNYDQFNVLSTAEYVFSGSVTPYGRQLTLSADGKNWIDPEGLGFAKANVVSGTNTGDETLASIKSKLLLTVLSGENTGDDTAASIRTKLGITTLSGANTGDETQSTILTKIGDGTKISAAHLPTYVDDVLEFANLAAFPATGESAKIYVALNANTTADPSLQYRWSGTVYTEVVARPGSTDNVPEGTNNKYWTNLRTVSSALTGYVIGVTNRALVVGDTILIALGVLEKKANDNAASIATKQNTLVSGSNIRTVNGQTLLGSTDLVIPAPPANTDALSEGATNKYWTNARTIGAVLTGWVIGAASTIAATDTISQAFGKVQKYIDDILNALAGKQATLVSGSNLRTVNGNSLLGSTDIVISGGSGTANIQKVANVGALPTINAGGGLDVVIVADLARGGEFFFRATGYVIDDIVVFGALTSGFWVRAYEGAVNLSWGGLVSEPVATEASSTDQTLIFKNTLTSGKYPWYYVPEGTFWVKAAQKNDVWAINIPKNTKITCSPNTFIRAKTSSVYNQRTHMFRWIEDAESCIWEGGRLFGDRNTSTAYGPNLFVNPTVPATQTIAGLLTQLGHYLVIVGSDIVVLSGGFTGTYTAGRYELGRPATSSVTLTITTGAAGTKNVMFSVGSEFGHVFGVRGSKNIVIRDVYVEGADGDGFSIDGGLNQFLNPWVPVTQTISTGLRTGVRYLLLIEGPGTIVLSGGASGSYDQYQQKEVFLTTTSLTLTVSGVGASQTTFVAFGEFTLNIEIINAEIRKCRRNGITVSQGIDIHLKDIVAYETKGTYPEAGIDVEPDANGVTIVKIENANCYSNYEGIAASGHRTEFVNCKVHNNLNRGIWTTGGSLNTDALATSTGRYTSILGGVNYSNFQGIVSDKLLALRVHGMEFENMAAEAILVGDNQYSEYNDLWFRNITSYAIRQNLGQKIRANNLNVEGGGSGGSHRIRLKALDIICRNSSVINSAGIAYFIDGCLTGAFQNNHADNIAQGGAGFWAIFNMLISGNTFKSIGTDTANGHSAIRFFDTGSLNTITNNKFIRGTSSPKNAIEFPATYTKNLLSGNDLKGFGTTADITDLGTGNSEIGLNVKRLAADVTNSNATANTMQDITGLQFYGYAGKTYRFLFRISYTAAALTTGARFSINGPTFSALNYNSQYSLTVTTVTDNQGLGAYNAPAAANASSAALANNLAIIEGFITLSADGFVVARFASEVLSSAIVAKAGITSVDWIEI